MHCAPSAAPGLTAGFYLKKAVRRDVRRRGYQCPDDVAVDRIMLPPSAHHHTVPSVSSSATVTDTNPTCQWDPCSRDNIMPSCNTPADVSCPVPMHSCEPVDHECAPQHAYSSYCHNPYQPIQAPQNHSAQMHGAPWTWTLAPKHLHHRQPIFQAPRAASSSAVNSPDHHPQPTSQQQRPMCCYFKQKGYCKMGAACWYSHEGDLYTPCHYGASCKAGHATLTLMREMGTTPVFPPQFTTTSCGSRNPSVTTSEANNSPAQPSTPHIQSPTLNSEYLSLP
jgi:hypothetical protein